MAAGDRRSAGKLAKLRRNEREAAEKAAKQNGQNAAKVSNRQNAAKVSKPGRQKSWLLIWAEDSKTPPQTARNWWRDFCKQTVHGWLINFGTSAETDSAPDHLPARAELEAIAKAR